MVEIIPKPLAKTPKWQKLLPYFAIAILIITILGYFILNNSLEKSRQTLKDLEDTLVKLKTPEKESLEKEILNYQKKIKDFSILIEQHLIVSNFFNLLEKITHPRIWFSDFELKPREAQVSLSGEAGSFLALGQQILIFKGEKKIQEIKLDNVSLDEKGKIKFDLSLSLSPEVFKF